jgi:hypothetical protein
MNENQRHPGFHTETTPNNYQPTKVGYVDTTPVELRRRRAASWRMPVLDGCGHRDPLGCLADLGHAPVSQRYGLTELERRRHARELADRWQWTPAEILAVMGVVAAAS